MRTGPRRSRLGFDSAPSDADADAELADTLDNLDDADNYAAWIFSLIEPHLGRRVLEIGAGHGTLTDLLAADGRSVVSTDTSERCVRMLRDRFSGNDHVDVVFGPIEAVAGRGPFDSVVLVNVLEHIADDERALADLTILLAPGGRLVLWVPAFEFLYSRLDHRIGHHRRYRVGELRNSLAQAGLAVLDLRYINTLGAVAWLVSARVLRRTPTVGRSVRIFDRYAVPVLRRAERGRRPPFGQSVFAVAQRPVT